MSPLPAEFAKIRKLALPVVGAQVGTMLLGVVDTIMVGHVSVEALAAASLANVWIFATTLFGMGVILGMDPLVAQAHGAGLGERAGLILQRGLVMAVLLSVPIGLSWLSTADFLALTGQEAPLVQAAHRYTQVQVPSIPFFLLFVVMRQYLQGREIMRPAMWAVAVANLFNVFFNWVLIFGKLGFPALGLVGAGIATTLTRLVMFALLLAMLRGLNLTEGAWTPWSRAAFEWRGLRRIVGLGIPVAIQMSLEMWAFSGSTLIAGHIGAEALAAHTITMNLAALAFMMPLGVSQAAATRVGNLLGAGRPREAQRAAWMAMALGAGVMAIAALTFVALRIWLPRIYTVDPGVVALSASILPIAAAFAIFDGTQVVGCGILRGMGNTRPAAWFNLIGYWVLGLPIGAWLALRQGFGLGGIWWGLAFGLAVVASLLVARIHRRGPAHAVALSETGE
jgi:MATE family multidrug resistance protein